MQQLLDFFQKFVPVQFTERNFSLFEYWYLLTQIIIVFLTFLIVISTLFSLLSLYKQTKAMAETLILEQWKEYKRQLSDFFKLLQENKKLRPYFWEGKKISPENKDYRKAVVVSRKMLNVLEKILIEDASEYEIVDDNPYIHKIIKNLLIRSPILRREILESRRKKWFYPKKIYEINDEATTLYETTIVRFRIWISIKQEKYYKWLKAKCISSIQQLNSDLNTTNVVELQKIIPYKILVKNAEKRVLYAKINFLYARTRQLKIKGKSNISKAKAKLYEAKKILDNLKKSDQKQ